MSRRHLTPFCFYTLLALGLGAAAIASRAHTTGTVLSLIGGGLMSWALLEYALHRFVFHYDAKSVLGRKFVHAAHLAHHEDPQALDRLFARLPLSLPIAALYWLAAWGATGSWSAASWMFIGLTAGYFAYEWLHYQAHHGAPRSRVLRYLKRYHLLHHYDRSDVRFGVTSPVLDLLLGTFLPAGGRRTSTRAGA